MEKGLDILIVLVIAGIIIASISLATTINLSGELFRPATVGRQAPSLVDNFYVMRSTPKTGDVSLHADVEIFFSRPVDKSTVTAQNIILKNERTGKAIEWSSTVKGRLVVLHPEEAYDYWQEDYTKLAENTEYSLTVTKGVKDTGGKKLDKEFNSGFITEEKSRYVYSDDIDVKFFNDRVNAGKQPWKSAFDKIVSDYAIKGMSEAPNPCVGAFNLQNNYVQFLHDAQKVHAMGVVADYLEQYGSSIGGYDYLDYANRVKLYALEWEDKCHPEDTLPSCGSAGGYSNWYDINYLLHTPMFLDGVARVWNHLDDGEKTKMISFTESLVLLMVEYSDKFHNDTSIKNYQKQCADAAGYEYKPSVYNGDVSTIPHENIPEGVEANLIAGYGIMRNDLLLDAATRGKLYTPQNYCSGYSYNTFAPVFSYPQLGWCDSFKEQTSPNQDHQGEPSESSRIGKWIKGDSSDPGQGYYYNKQAKHRASSGVFLSHYGIDMFNHPEYGVNHEGSSFELCFNWIAGAALEEYYLFYYDKGSPKQWTPISNWPDKPRTSGAISDFVYRFYRSSNIQDTLKAKLGNSYRPFKDSHFIWAFSLDALDVNDKVGNEPPHPIEDLKVDFLGSNEFQIGWNVSFPSEEEGWDKKPFKHNITVNGYSVAWPPGLENKFVMRNLKPNTLYHMEVKSINYWGQESPGVKIDVKTLGV
jgi:hypothetical protein